MTRYTPARDDEPLTIDASVVAALLEKWQRPRMAAYVRRIGAMVADTYSRERELREACDALQQRLWQYEPRPKDFVPPSYVPPPESSD